MKSKKICEHCGKEQDINAEFCSNCKSEFKLEPETVLDVDLEYYGDKPKDTSKLPNLRKQEWDNTNPDLDKRYIPENSCWNCNYGQTSEINQYTIQGSIDVFCKKYNYMVKESNNFEDIGYLYAICDDFISKSEFKQTPKGKIENLGWMTFGMYFVYWLIPAFIFCIPMIIIDPNVELSWTSGYVVGMDFFFFCLAYPLAKIWRKKQIKKYQR